MIQFHMANTYKLAYYAQLQVISYNYIDNEEDKASHLFRKALLPTRSFTDTQSANDRGRFLSKLM